MGMSMGLLGLSSDDQIQPYLSTLYRNILVPWPQATFDLATTISTTN